MAKTKLLGLMVIALVGAGLLAEEADARRRSSSRRSSSWGSSSRRSSSWGSSSRSSSYRGSSYTRSRRTRRTRTPASYPKPTMQGASGELFERAEASGTSFKSRQDALAHFRGAGAMQSSTFRASYPLSFPSQPAGRPAYVPASISRDGRAHDVRWHGGTYGYWSGGAPDIGSFVALGVADMLVTDQMLSSRGYYYGPPPSGYYGRHYPRYGAGTSPGIMSWIGLIVLGMLVSAAVGFVRRRMA